TDERGCQSSDSVLITVREEDSIIPSKVLSPNGDNYNDTWEVENIVLFPNAEVSVFNSYGSLVFKAKNYQNNWRGTSSNGNPLPEGAYFYVIAVPESGHVLKGSLNILR
ncbi:MAG: gliding motility-associated C-terminal domain-containing protein, partial [Bernardetiaceae bacterium]|nr:gliding motility-associated C-terminal domain-containing protein [Bernardetiaceae bacterium]